MSTYPTRLTANATTRRIIVAAILSPAAALLVLSPSATAADQVAINGQVKDSIVQPAAAKIPEIADGRITRRICHTRTHRHNGHVVWRVKICRVITIRT
jgi:hypothetical protein